MYDVISLLSRHYEVTPDTEMIEETLSLLSRHYADTEMIKHYITQLSTKSTTIHVYRSTIRSGSWKMKENDRTFYLHEKRDKLRLPLRMSTN